MVEVSDGLLCFTSLEGKYFAQIIKECINLASDLLVLPYAVVMLHFQPSIKNESFTCCLPRSGGKHKYRF